MPEQIRNVLPRLCDFVREINSQIMQRRYKILQQKSKKSEETLDKIQKTSHTKKVAS
ncbi:MAG: hypothetical protein PUP91_05805 [Rhizonema sp. PD37]|nr:hypothetical protein [Rhizonema sp. PD37]